MPRKSTKKRKEKLNDVTPKLSEYRVTFLENQMFRGKYYQSGESEVVVESVYNAYKGRTQLKFERI